MASKILLEILSILGFIVLLYLGMKLSKNKKILLKTAGYILMIASIAGLLIDFYRLFSG